MWLRQVRRCTRDVSDEPQPPQRLRVTSQWCDHVTLAWDAPDSDGGKPITGYVIERRDAQRSSWVRAGSTKGDALSFKAENLFEGAEYYFRCVFKIRRL